MNKTYDGTVVMSFGKHAGKTVEEIPDGYLAWMRDNLDEPRNTELIKAADEELEWRKEWGKRIDG